MYFMFYFCFYNSRLRILSGLNYPYMDSNPSACSVNMCRSMAILLTLDRKLALNTFGCLLGPGSYLSRKSYLLPFFFPFKTYLIFSMSIIRSICLIVNWLSLSYSLGLMIFWSILSLRQYLGTYSLLIFCYIGRLLLLKPLVWTEN